MIAGHAAGRFSGVCIDSREARPGDLFVAFRGEHHDGHAFVADALRHGAFGALVEKIPDGLDPEGQHPIVQVRSSADALTSLASTWRRKHAVRVIGVTGSVGKTTTKDVIASLLSPHFNVLRTPANLNTELGLAMCVMELEPSHQVAVLEMGMHDVGEIAQLAAIAQPEVGVVTNVFPTHLERLGTIERIAQAKGELIRALPASGLAILNADDERVLQMADWSPCRTLLIGVTESAELRAAEIQGLGLAGTDCTFVLRNERVRTHLPLPGRHTVYPAMAALGVAVHLGLSFREAAAGLELIAPGPRLAVVPGPAGVTLIDDTYNASPASAIAALDLLQQLDGRHVAVLGDMLELGTFEEEGHRSVGRRAVTAADWLLVVGERARFIAAEARSAGMPVEQVEEFQTTGEIIHRLQSGLLPGDYVLIKGSRAMRLDSVVTALRQTAQVV